MCIDCERTCACDCWNETFHYEQIEKFNGDLPNRWLIVCEKCNHPYDEDTREKIYEGED